MSFLLALAGGALGGALSAIFDGPPTAPEPTPTPTRDDTAKLVAKNDALARRKGAAADILTGASGAEAAPANVGRLILGS